MRPLFDEFDEFAFDDSAAVNRILREQRKEEHRLASRKPYSPDDDSYFDEMDSFDDYEDYNDYNEDEFDTHSGIEIEN
ncbi:MAG TPA: hypothetical protein PKK10_15235 [Woeseiaceae bacterium]|nr:hypothetical protein [Woeseiaceae bacterium]